MSRVSAVPFGMLREMLRRWPSEHRSKSCFAGLNRSGKASWVIRIMLASRDSISERMAFSVGDMKGETITVPLDALSIQRALFFSFSSSENILIFLIY